MQQHTQIGPVSASVRVCVCAIADDDRKNKWCLLNCSAAAACCLLLYFVLHIALFFVCRLLSSTLFFDFLYVSLVC